jgi:hypothetical protein
MWRVGAAPMLRAMTHRSRAALLALALSVLPASDAFAAPKAPKMPQMATFDVTIRGSQVTTWSLRQTDDPNDPCDVPAQGDGSQMLRFFSKPTRIQVLRDGPWAIAGQAITAPLSVEREGDLTNLASDMSGCPVVAEGDGDGDFLVPLKDCGLRKGKIDLRLDFGDAKLDDDFLVPLVAKNTLAVRGDFAQINTYDECPWWEGGPAEGPSDTAISTAARKFTISSLFNRRRSVLRSSADLTRHYTADGFTGKTLLTWNVTLKRVR